jgi:hypothetical protein
MLRMNARLAGATVAALVLLPGALAGSYVDRRAPVGWERAFRAEYPARCIPANGAQVLGGHAAPTDWLDPVTGDICTPRRGELPD